jgi:rubrerythrin
VTGVELAAALQAAREAEKEQALFYRALAAEAEARGEAELGERFNELHADEQHHLSRLTARLLELGASPAALAGARPELPALEAWEEAARVREEEEVRRYAGLLAREPEAATAALLREVLETERRHVEHLGGKWTRA